MQVTLHSKKILFSCLLIDKIKLPCIFLAWFIMMFVFFFEINIHHPVESMAGRLKTKHHDEMELKSAD